ncbi:hypothetical protein NQZ68_031495 [Dissostichus eleginoides]|nr:hypothetical protein NQZ68_031495 [Dissostichus eleginoides]
MCPGVCSGSSYQSRAELTRLSAANREKAELQELYSCRATDTAAEVKQIAAREGLQSAKSAITTHPHAGGRAVTSLVDPVYLSGLRRPDQHSHFDLQPFVWPFVSGEKEEGCSFAPQGSGSSFYANSQTPACAVLLVRGTPVCLTACPPLSSWMPFIQQPPNHRSAFEEKKAFASGLAALGGAVAKGRVSLSDG